MIKTIINKYLTEIDTISANIPGNGPIADTQNGLKSFNINKRKKKILDDLDSLIDDEINEKSKISADEIINIIGINKLKKFKTINSALDYIEEQLTDLMVVMKIQYSEIPMNEIKEKLKNIIG